MQKMTYTQALQELTSSAWDMFWFSILAHILLFMALRVVERLWDSHQRYKRQNLRDHEEIAKIALNVYKELQKGKSENYHVVDNVKKNGG